MQTELPKNRSANIQPGAFPILLPTNNAPGQRSALRPPGSWRQCTIRKSRKLAKIVLPLLVLVACASASRSAEPQPVSAIRHSYLVLGGKTAIIGEDGQAQWEYAGGSRDGFVLPNGNALIAYSDRVEEITRDKQVVFTYKRSKENSEIGTTQRLYNGNTLVTELGGRPRLLEISPQGRLVLEFPLQPETDN